jgi:hypothetical protein
MSTVVGPNAAFDFWNGGREQAIDFWNRRRPYRISDPTQNSGYRRATAREVDDQWIEHKSGQNIGGIQLYKLGEGFCSPPTLWEFGIGVFLYFISLLRGSILLLVCSVAYFTTIKAYAGITDRLTAQNNARLGDTAVPVQWYLQGCAISRRICNAECLPACLPECVLDKPFGSAGSPGYAVAGAFDYEDSCEGVRRYGAECHYLFRVVIANHLHATQ